MTFGTSAPRGSGIDRSESQRFRATGLRSISDAEEIDYQLHGVLAGTLSGHLYADCETAPKAQLLAELIQGLASSSNASCAHKFERPELARLLAVVLNDPHADLPAATDRLFASVRCR